MRRLAIGEHASIFIFFHDYVFVYPSNNFTIETSRPTIYLSMSPQVQDRRTHLEIGVGHTQLHTKPLGDSCRIKSYSQTLMIHLDDYS